MDTNATLARLVDALNEGDLDEACHAVGDLITWIERGGEAPTPSVEVWSAIRELLTIA